MKFFRRSLIALGVAATLPTIVFAAVGVFYLLRIERERVETATLARTETIMALVDARLQRDLAVLRVLSSLASPDDDPSWSGFQERAARVLNSNPAWVSLAAIDASSGREVLRLPRQSPDAPHLGGSHATALTNVTRSGIAQVGAVERASEPLIWIYAPVWRDGSVDYVLAAGIRTEVFQRILLSHAPRKSTAAIVDRSGNFVARTLSYEERVGTPATKYVRAAIKEGVRGFYRGETYEGLQNYTAFHSSDLSHWSTHIAVASSLIDAPTAWSFAVAALAGLGAVLLAVVLVALVLRDMAERRNADEALRQSQKMEAIGQLTGGIAHDFNNLLTAIIGNLDMIQNRAAGNERLQRLASNALEAARRGAKLAAQLLAFSRTQRMTVRRIDLQQLLTGMSGLLAQSVGPSVRVEIDIDPDARLVVSDVNQLELALLNLAVNARDAMSGAGTLRITAHRIEAPPRQLAPGQYVDICVSDTGAGMSDEVRTRAIEPFFTTKPLGQGTGLGLSQVYGVVHESGGALMIDSEPGTGTTVHLMLRRATQADPLTRPAPSALPSVAASGQEHEKSVLVVDDDRLVRRFMSESLRGLGYRVMDTHDGASALELLNAHTFDLLVVDFAMPGMNGAEVARHARAKDPNLRILVVSGYADSAALEAAVGSTAQLRKPFDLAELSAAVSEVLQNPP
jgi:signal transduction histidine kinase